MSDENAVRISGTAADTPVLRYTEKGTPEAHFTLASRREFRDAAGRPYVRTVFVCIAAWRGAALEIATHVKRGRPVEVEGYLSRDDPRTGDDKRAQIVVTAERIETETAKAGTGNGEQGTGQKETAVAAHHAMTTLPLDGLKDQPPMAIGG